MAFRHLTRGQLIFAIVLGVVNGVYIFQPEFKQIGEEQRAGLLKATEEINLRTRRIFNRRSSLMYKTKTWKVLQVGFSVVIMITLVKNAGLHTAKRHNAEDYANIVYESHMKSEIESVREITAQE